MTHTDRIETPTQEAPVDTVLLDVDGTLIDSNPLHALAWLRAFSGHDLYPERWRVHRAIGMGGDQLVGGRSAGRTSRTPSAMTCAMNGPSNTASCYPRCARCRVRRTWCGCSPMPAIGWHSRRQGRRSSPTQRWIYWA